jgi:hypothetical protein
MKTEENKEVVAQEAQTPAAAPAQEQAAPDLTIADLNSVRAIIDVACQRGAFKAPEMELVGKTFNKLNAFLEAATKNSQPAQGQE